MSISKADFDDLKYAKMLLENPSLAARISNLLGTPIEKGFEHLPAKWKGIFKIWLGVILLYVDLKDSMTKI